MRFSDRVTPSGATGRLACAAAAMSLDDARVWVRARANVMGCRPLCVALPFDVCACRSKEACKRLKRPAIACDVARAPHSMRITCLRSTRSQNAIDIDLTGILPSKQSCVASGKS